MPTSPRRSPANWTRRGWCLRGLHLLDEHGRTKAAGKRHCWPCNLAYIRGYRRAKQRQRLSRWAAIPPLVPCIWFPSLAYQAMLQAAHTAHGTTRPVPGDPWGWRHRDQSLNIRREALSYFPRGTRMISGTGLRVLCPYCGRGAGYLSESLHGWVCWRCLRPMRYSRHQLWLSGAWGGLRLGVKGRALRWRLERLSSRPPLLTGFEAVAHRLSVRMFETAVSPAWHAGRTRRLSGFMGALGPLGCRFRPVWMQIVWDNAACPDAFRHRWYSPQLKAIK